MHPTVNIQWFAQNIDHNEAIKPFSDVYWNNKTYKSRQERSLVYVLNSSVTS